MRIKGRFFTEIFTAPLLITAALIIVAVVLLGQREQNPDPVPAAPSAFRKPFRAPDGVSWPTARGDQALSGAADPLPASPVRVWTRKLKGPIRSAAVLGNGRAYVGCSDRGIYCLRLDDGAVEWRFDAGAPVEAAPLLAGSLFAGTLGGDFFSIDPGTGGERWRAKPGGKISGHANFFERQGGAAVVIGTHDSVLRCFDASTGESIWTFEAGGYINGGPAVSAGSIVFGSCDGLVYAAGFDGTAKGSADASSHVPGSVAISGGRVFACHFENGIVCAGLPEMAVLWHYSAGNLDAAFFSSPAAAGGMVAAGSRDGNVHCVAADSGKLLWKAACGSAVDSSPVICGDRVLAATVEGRLLLLDVRDGAVAWSFEAGGGFSASPAVSRGMFVIGSDDGFVHAFGSRVEGIPGR